MADISKIKKVIADGKEEELLNLLYADYDANEADMIASNSKMIRKACEARLRDVENAINYIEYAVTVDDLDIFKYNIGPFIVANYHAETFFHSE